MKSFIRGGLTSLVLPLFFLAGSAIATADQHETKGHSCDKTECTKGEDCTCGDDCKGEGKCDCAHHKKDGKKDAKADGKAGCGCDAEKKSEAKKKS